MIEAIKH